MGQYFDQKMLNFFQCDRGAFSVVTNDEYSKSQITFVGPEQDIVESFFGATLDGHHGNIEHIKSNGIDPELEFNIHPIGTLIKLTVSYKTNKPRELRFYTRTDVYRPKAGEYWCIFEKSNKIWLGAFSQRLLDLVSQGKLKGSSRFENLENEVDAYQYIINLTDPKKVKSTILKWQRNPKIAAKALLAANHTCEIHPEFPTFVSRATGNRYAEAHHLIPMKLQNEFGKDRLDVIENICILNPTIHRMIHFGRFVDIEEDLSLLMSKRVKLLKRLSLHENDVLEMYL